MLQCFILQTMGGEFTGGKGQQECAKGIYCLAGMQAICQIL